MAFRFLKTDWRNIVIALLAGTVLGLGVKALPELAPAEIDLSQQGNVTVLDLIVDREDRRSFDFVFNRPLGEDEVGEFFVDAPATIDPPVGGVWRWVGANVLRFEATERLQPATQYRIGLIAERLLEPGQKLVGETSFKLVTDRFQALRVDVREEPAPGTSNRVVIHAESHFNYPVDPQELYRQIRLIDPLKGPRKPLQVHLETTYTSRVFSFRSEPVEKRREERNLEFRILSTLTPAHGNLALGADFVTLVPIGSGVNWTVREVSVQAGESESTVKLALSSPVDPEAAVQHIQIDPEVDFRISKGGNDLYLAGPFQPGVTYQLTVRAGLPALDESVLAEDRSERLFVPDLTPAVKFRHEGMFLSANGHRRLEIEAVNVRKVNLTVDRVYRNNLVFLFRNHGHLFGRKHPYGGGISPALGDRLTDQSIAFSGPRNRTFRRTLNLDRYVKDDEPGLYRIAIRNPGQYRTEQRWALITDLGVMAKRGRDDFLVWVSSFRNLRPVAGARVELISFQNQRIAAGRTNSAGMWRLPPEEGRFDKHQPYLVTVRSGDDFSFLWLNNSGVDTAGLDIAGDAPASTGYQSYLYGERDLYRPGETVKGLAIVRGDDLSTPPGMPLTLHHRDPQGRERGVQKLELQPGGWAEFAVETAPYDRTGNHWFELVAGEKVIGTYRFQIEEFVPDRIKVAISTEEGDVQPGEPLRYEVAGAYLFGPPAAGLPVESRVRLISAPFSPASFPGFQFGNSERRFASREILTRKERLDESGLKSFEAALPPALRPPCSLMAVITARVQEQGGRGVTAMRQRRVHPYPYYLGLRRRSRDYAEPGKEQVIEFVAVNPSGQVVPAGALRAEFIRDRWQTVLRRTASGNYRYETIKDPALIESRSLPAGSGRGTLSFTPPEFGGYRVVVTDIETGASSQIEFYASGWGYSPWAIKNPGRLEIDLEKEEYQPGENGILQIRAPFAGKLLLTVERGRIFHSEVHELSGNTARLSVPVRTAYRPNVYVTATLVRPADKTREGGVARAFGAVPLYVDRSSNRLAVELEAPEVIRPHSTLRIGVTGPPNGFVTVSAVDEGILQLIAQNTPDPFDYFYRKMGLRVSSYDIYSLLLPEVTPIEGASAAGGGRTADGLAQFLRTEGIRRVEPVAFWSGVLPTDASGKAGVEFPLPEFQGALRLMAVAHKEDRFGAAEAMTRVRSPLALLPTFPRFLSFQESVMIPVTVRNDTGRPGRFQVELALEGPATAGQAAQRIDVPDSSERTIHFPVKTGETPGDLRFRLTARGNDETASVEAGLPVRPDLPAQTQRQVTVLTEAATTLPDAGRELFFPATVKRDLRISSLPIVRFSANLRDLLRYPYGCLEQTVSRAFPLVYLGDLAKELDPDLFAEYEPAALVQQGIRRLSSMQLGGGGFAMWPDGDTVYPWGSFYATHFLVEARRAGYQVPDWVYDRALDYLAKEVKAVSSYTRPELQKAAYGLFVLARAGKPDPATMDFIRRRHVEDLRSSGRALLGSAYASTGNPEALRELIQGLEDAEKVERENGGHLNSTIRNRALLLLAVLEADPNDARAPILVERLSREAQTSYWTTQESSFVFLALGQYFKGQAAKGPFSGKVLVDGKTVGTFGRRTAVFRNLGPGPVTIQMDPGYSPGAAFCSLTVRGIPRPEVYRPASQGLEIQREFRTREGRPLAETKVAQGDLVVVRTRVRSVSGRLQNVVVSTLLPAGLEVENPRLKTTEASRWMTGVNLTPDHQDLRDDRVLFFTNLPANQWRSSYTLLRAVTPGSFRLPPPQAEAMYDPSIRASGPRGVLEVEVKK